MSDIKITLNDELSFCFPDTFRVLDEAERSKMNFIEDGPGKILSDHDRHILISFGWKTIGGFSAKLLGENDITKNMMSKIRKAMKPFGYCEAGSFSVDIGGEKAEGFGYEYVAQGVEMYGQSYAIKHGKVLYYLNFYTRREFKNESLDIWNKILSTGGWKSGGQKDGIR